METHRNASSQSRLLATTWSPLWILAATLLIAAALARGVHYTGGIKGSVSFQRDYDNLYAGGWCMLHHCDPYSITALDSVLRAHGDLVDESRWLLQLPIYPPTTLMLVSPLSTLPYLPGVFLWALLNRGVWTFGLLWAFLWSPVLEGRSIAVRIASAVFFLASTDINHGLSFGNPAYMVAGLVLFVATDVPQKRQLLHAVVLFLAIILKPQLAFLYVILLLCRNRPSRQTAYGTLALLALFTVATLAYAALFPATAHWHQGLVANLRLGQSAGVSMNPSLRTTESASDPMLHLQYLFGYWIPDAHKSQVLSLGVAAILAGLIAFPLLRGLWRHRRPLSDMVLPAWSDDLYLAGLGAITMWMFLPVYHRWSDLCMLAVVLVVSLHFLLVRSMPVRTGLAVLTICLLTFATFSARLHPTVGGGALHAVLNLLYFRADTVLIFLLTLLSVSTLWSVAGDAASSPTIQEP